MAKNAERQILKRSRILWLAAGLVAALTAAGSAAEASSLRMRPPCMVTDVGMMGISEGLYFKLKRLNGSPESQSSMWESMVEDALLIALRMGFPAQMPVTAQRIGNAYVVVLQGEGHIAGADPDQVLGRLLYTLAHAESAPTSDMSAVALSIVDQPLSVTASTLAYRAP